MKHDCGGKLLTKDTRQIEAGIWRRRVCDKCDQEVTTLEQVCETLKNPYPNKKGAALEQGAVIAPPVPKVDRPNPPNKRGKDPNAHRKAKQAQPKPLPKTAPPKAKREEQRVDRLTPTARDRIEDMKFEREQSDYGWDR